MWWWECLPTNIFPNLLTALKSGFKSMLFFSVKLVYFVLQKAHFRSHRRYITTTKRLRSCFLSSFSSVFFSTGTRICAMYNLNETAAENLLFFICKFFENATDFSTNDVLVSIICHISWQNFTHRTMYKQKKARGISSTYLWNWNSSQFISISSRTLSSSEKFSTQKAVKNDYGNKPTLNI